MSTPGIIRDIAAAAEHDVIKRKKIAYEDFLKDIGYPSLVFDKPQDPEFMLTGPIPLTLNSTITILGSGKSGTVILGHKTDDQKEVAVKVSKDNGFNNIVECQMLESLKHENILQCFGYSIIEDHFCMVTEFMAGGSLGELIPKRSTLDPRKRSYGWRQIVALLIQLAKALECLHSQGLVHGDVSSKNLLLSGDRRTLKLADFEMAARLKIGIRCYDPSKLIIGTLPYTSPESYQGSDNYKAASDMYSFGRVMGAIILGKSCDEPIPYYLSCIKEGRIFDPVFNTQPKDFAPWLLNFFDNNIEVAKAFLALGLQLENVDPSKRPSAESVVAQLQKLLEYPIEPSVDGEQFPPDHDASNAPLSDLPLPAPIPLSKPPLKAPVVSRRFLYDVIPGIPLDQSPWVPTVSRPDDATPPAQEIKPTQEHG